MKTRAAPISACDRVGAGKTSAPTVVKALLPEGLEPTEVKALSNQTKSVAPACKNTLPNSAARAPCFFASSTSLNASCVVPLDPPRIPTTSDGS